jgi:cell fate regulator YaaT (PSP1 superfamily)
MNDPEATGSEQPINYDLGHTMRLVTIKFRDAGKRYDFNAQAFDLDKGAQIIVETERGKALGTVVTPPFDIESATAPKDVKNVLRLATDEDLALAATNRKREKEALKFCQQRISERNLEMKLVRAEYLFDGSKIIFYFTADGRIDFRELVKDLAHYFHTRIEMRQIGVRDEAKLVGGLGVCGRELCCCTFLTEFSPVSVKMAKEQGLALNPNKISGQCGRLLCCLSYEFETYCSLRKGLPKTGKKVQFDNKPAEVIEVNILGQKLTLRFENGDRTSITLEQFNQGNSGDKLAETSTEPISAPAKPAQQRRKQRPAKKQPDPATTADRNNQTATPKTDAEKPAEQENNKPKRRRRRGRRKPKQDAPGEN